MQHFNVLALLRHDTNREMIHQITQGSHLRRISFAFNNTSHMVLYTTLQYDEIYQQHIIHTHTHPFNGPLSRTTQLSRYQKGKTNQDFTEARDSEWQWHQLGHMQVCTSLQTDNHASTPPVKFFTGRMPFLPPNQQRQSTEGCTQYMIKSWQPYKTIAKVGKIRPQWLSSTSVTGSWK